VVIAKTFVGFSLCVTLLILVVYAKSACEWFVNNVSAKAVIHLKRNSNAKKPVVEHGAGLKE